MKLTKEERTKLTYEIGDIIEQKCRRCHYNRQSFACHNSKFCKDCPTGEELFRLGRYFDSGERKHRGPKKDIPEGLTTERIRELNEHGFPDYKIGPMFGRSENYISRLKQYWKQDLGG